MEKEEIKKIGYKFMRELIDELSKCGKKEGEKIINKTKIKSSPFGLKYVDGWNDALEAIKQKLKRSN